MLIHVCDRHDDELRPATTKTLTIDGRAVEMDLCPEHEQQLLQVLEPFIEAARTMPANDANGASRRQPRRAPRISAAVSSNGHSEPTTEPVKLSAELSKDERRDIRQWAIDNGYEVNIRGSLKQSIVDDYFAAALV